MIHPTNLIWHFRPTTLAAIAADLVGTEGEDSSDFYGLCRKALVANVGGDEAARMIDAELEPPTAVLTLKGELVTALIELADAIEHPIAEHRAKARAKARTLIAKATGA